MIELQNISKKFGKKKVLSNLNCQLEKGVYGLLGPNGTGKTTLMRCMTNLYQDWSGDIRIDGKSIRKRNSQTIGYLPQNFGMFHELSVEETLQYMCNLKKISRKYRKDEIERCLQLVYLESEKRTQIKKLSGGMLRRVGIAQSLLGNPDILLFDEPTAGLDPEERAHFKEILLQFGKREIVVVSTHIIEDVEATCSSIIIMKNGTIQMIGTCDEIKEAAGKTKLKPTLEDGYLAIIRS